jgi:4-hydroxy-3-polyprenylbenzoate decarboxylase
VLLFEDVRDAHGGGYDMRVAAGIYGASEEVVILGTGCETPQEALDRWHHALENPLPPRLVDSGPVHEVIHVGDDLLERGLDGIPVPLEEPGFSQMIRTGLPMITRDPVTGSTNVGTYNGFFRDRTRLVAGIGGGKDGLRHWETARARGEELPVAIIIGATPNVMLAGSAALPFGVEELAVAGGLAGAPLDIVRCKTIPLEVPAHAEIVIEGMISPEVAEPRLAFGEYPGYMNVDRDLAPVMRVTAITHRKDAIFTPVLVGFPPSDCNAQWSFVNAANLYHHLRYSCGLPVEEIHIPEMSGGKDFTMIRLQKGARPQVATQVLNVAAGLWYGSKYLVALDHDIDPRDPDMLIWALSYRVKPETDIVIQGGRSPGLDPAKTHSRVLIDTTKSGRFPPLALPRKDFMERAVQIWSRHPELPKARLRSPWHGYSLGLWTSEDDELAEMMVQGDYKGVGRRSAEMQVGAESLVGLAR